MTQARIPAELKELKWIINGTLKKFGLKDKAQIACQPYPCNIIVDPIATETGLPVGCSVSIDGPKVRVWIYKDQDWKHINLAHPDGIDHLGQTFQQVLG